MAMLLLLGIGLLALSGMYLYISRRIPTEKQLKNIQNHTASEVYSADGVLMGKYYIYERSNVTFEDLSPDLVHALVATEDARFYEHDGIDGIGLLRVLVKSILLQQESAGGGSTLSQQLVKNIFPRKNYGIFSMPLNKMREALTAQRLEKVYSKKEVIALYLNTVPFGDNAYGIKVAARRFFNKTPKTLGIQESAVLVGMLKATTSYNPRRNPERSRERRNVVLTQMHNNGYLSAATADSLCRLPLTLHYTYEDHHQGLAPYFREQLRQEVQAWCATHPNEEGEEYNIYTDGLKIYTTIDSRMQRHGEEAVREHMGRLQQQFFQHWKGQRPWGKNTAVIEDAKRRSGHYKVLKEQGVSEKEINAIFNKPVPMKIFTWQGDKEVTMSPMDSLRYYQYFLQAGLLVTDPQSGYVKAWVGGIDHEYFQYDHVNTNTKRQAGSTFKPIVYASALRQGIDPCERFADEKKTYEQYDGWSPGNAENEYGGTYSMEGALTRSVNTVSAELIVRSGIENTIALSRQMGISSEMEPIPSIALGSCDVSLTEMVTAYGVLANRGRMNPSVYLMRIVDKYGKEIYRHTQRKPKQVLTQEQSDMITHMLQQVVNEGTGSSLRTVYGFRGALAGKTGTTQSQADGWFIGYTPSLVAGVWVGAEDRRVHFRSLALGKGASMALPIWAKFMAKVSKDPALKEWRGGSFPVLSPEVQAKLDCPMFEEAKEGLWDKLFGGRKEEREKRKEEKAKRKKEKSGKGLFGLFRKKEEEE